MTHRGYRLAWSIAALGALSACQNSEPQRADDAAQPAARPSASASAKPASEQSTSTTMTCTYPVSPADTAAALRARYGKDARLETLPGAEGSEFEGLVLWPDDRSRRVEIVFEDDAMLHPSTVRVWEGSQWRIAGIGLGDPFEKVRAANGGPFEFYGFSWDYGGYVSDLMGGKLASLGNGCGLSLRLGPSENAELADSLIGEGSVSSEDPLLASADVTVEELTLQFDGEDRD